MGPELALQHSEDHDVFETIEQVLEGFGWHYERDGYDTMQCILPTRWGEMGCMFASRLEPVAMHYSLTLDVKPQEAKKTLIRELILLMNERLWLGHFDYWQEDQVIIFRHTLPLLGRLSVTPGEVQSLMQAALDAAERFIPAFNFVVWAGKSPAEALEAVMFETDGEA